MHVKNKEECFKKEKKKKIKPTNCLKLMLTRLWDDSTNGLHPLKDC